jgi:hypothetical protein
MPGVAVAYTRERPSPTKGTRRSHDFPRASAAREQEHHLHDAPLHVEHVVIGVVRVGRCHIDETERASLGVV